MPYLTRFAVAALLALNVAAPGRVVLAEPETKSALETAPEGWTDLLSSADFARWTRLPIPATAKLSPRSQWEVDANQKRVMCEGNAGHEWLRFDRELGDFILHVEWRYTRVPGKTGYNSGVFVRNSTDGKIWHQAQVGAGSGGYLFGDTPVAGKVQRFNLRDRLTTQRVKDAGEWNTYEVTCRGNTITLWVNGVVTNQWSPCEVPRGYIGLEAEGWRIEFRNLRLKELK